MNQRWTAIRLVCLWAGLSGCSTRPFAGPPALGTMFPPSRHAVARDEAIGDPFLNAGHAGPDEPFGLPRGEAGAGTAAAETAELPFDPAERLHEPTGESRWRPRQPR